MNSLKEKIAASLKRTAQAALMRGTVGRVEADETVTINVPGQPGRIYVTVAAGGADPNTLLIARNQGAPLLAGLPVLVDYDADGQAVVTGPDPLRAEQYGGYGVGSVPPSVPPHANYHRIGGGDELVVAGRQLEPLLVTVSDPPSMQVNVAEGFYEGAAGWAYFTGDTLDLTASVPGTAGEHRWALVYLDTSTGALGAANSTPISVLVDLLASSLAAVSLPAGALALAGVRLTNGIAAIDEEVLFTDARAWLSKPGAAPPALTVGDGSTTAVSVDQITFSGATVTNNGSGDVTVSIPAPAAGIPVGAMMLWYTATPPTGWLLCQGQAVSAALYPALAAVLGSSGGNITLPNLQGRFPLGVSAGYPLNTTGGAAAHTLTIDEVPAHSHTFRLRTLSGQNNNNDSGSRGGTGGTDVFPATSSTGGGLPHNNMPPYLALNFIIKVN